MGTWGFEPWQNERAADWFDGFFELTGLASHLEETLHRTVEDASEEIRAAVFILLALDRAVWPPGMYERCEKAAQLRLTEMLERKVFTNPALVEAIERQLARLVDVACQ